MATLPLTTPTVIPDAALVSRMAQRDATALVELERRYGASLYAMVYGILMDAERAERLVAHVFEQIWHTAEALSARHGGAHSWLRQAARECALKHRAKPQKLKELEGR
jgi:RNA polymerase sigma-70 factor (ECF subfamily)